MGGLPIGLANRVKLVRNVRAGQCITWADVRIDETDETYRYRRAMELDQSVMAGLDPAIRCHTGGGVGGDGRDKPGHDDRSRPAMTIGHAQP